MPACMKYRMYYVKCASLIAKIKKPAGVAASLSVMEYLIKAIKKVPYSLTFFLRVCINFLILRLIN